MNSLCICIGNISSCPKWCWRERSRPHCCNAAARPLKQKAKIIAQTDWNPGFKRAYVYSRPPFTTHSRPLCNHLHTSNGKRDFKRRGKNPRIGVDKFRDTDFILQNSTTGCSWKTNTQDLFHKTYYFISLQPYLNNFCSMWISNSIRKRFSTGADWLKEYHVTINNRLVIKAVQF